MVFFFDYYFFGSFNFSFPAFLAPATFLGVLAGQVFQYLGLGPNNEKINAVSQIATFSKLPFFGEGSPNIDCREKGTLILASLLEDLEE